MPREAARRNVIERFLRCHGPVTPYEIANHTGWAVGEIEIQDGPLWTDCAQLLYKPPVATGAWIEIPFEVAASEPRRLVLRLTSSYDFGIYDISLDGIVLRKDLDLYAPTTAVNDVPLLDFYPEPGTHTVRLVCQGRNPLSTGCWLGLDSLRLRERRPRVAQYGWDKDKDWRTERILY